MTTIKELQDRAYKQSADKGFHDNEPTEERALLSYNAEKIALIHSEASEALEELRKGSPAHLTYYSDFNRDGVYKPEGVPSEMADIVIRVLDFCGANGIDLERIIVEKLDYNATRPRKHGGKKF